MSSVTIGIIGIVVLLVLFLIRVPVAFSMLIVGVAGFSLLTTPKAGLALLGSDLFSQLSKFSFSVIPMFVFAGSLGYVSGMGQRLFSAMYALTGRLPGSIALSSIAACAGFSAICGSTTATAATMGKIAIPVMRKYHYDHALATGSIATAGALGVLIPPSTVFIIYAILTEQSIGKLFIAGILPGILLTVLLALTVLIRCTRNRNLAPMGPASTKKEKLAGLVGCIETLSIFALVMCGLILGWFSPTQAGGVLGGGIFLLAVLRRKLTVSDFIESLKDATRVTCMVMLIISAAIIFGRFMAITRIPMILSDWLVSLPLPPMAIMVLLVVIYMIGGCFMDGMALLTLTIPIIFPAIVSLGFDPIWFGVLFVVVGEMGVITPPVGINVYVIKGVVPDIPLSVIFRGIFPFLFALAICVALLMAFPQIAMFLPSLMTY